MGRGKKHVKRNILQYKKPGSKIDRVLTRGEHARYCDFRHMLYSTVHSANRITMQMMYAQILELLEFTCARMRKGAHDAA